MPEAPSDHDDTDQRPPDPLPAIRAFGKLALAGFVIVAAIATLALLTPELIRTLNLLLHAIGAYLP